MRSRFNFTNSRHIEFDKTASIFQGVCVTLLKILQWFGNIEAQESNVSEEFREESCYFSFDITL